MNRSNMELPDIQSANCYQTWIGNTETGAEPLTIGRIYPSQNINENNIQTFVWSDAIKTCQKEKNTMTQENKEVRRMVQVFIADPDKNIPLEKAMLYQGDSIFTDLTDQELFFEISIKEILDKHNKFRITWFKKNTSENRKNKLEPIKIRDLKMVVVTIAQF